jgi:ribosomal protein L4
MCKIGLARWPSKPTARQRSMSSRKTLAVNAKIRIPANRAPARILRTASTAVRAHRRTAQANQKTRDDLPIGVAVLRHQDGAGIASHDG